MLWPGLAALLDPRQPVRGQFRRDCCCYCLRNGQHRHGHLFALGRGATNATLAFLGGGTIAEGAGGMALGATVLNVLAIGPALLVGGSMVKRQGSKALTHARNVGRPTSMSRWLNSTRP